MTTTPLLLCSNRHLSYFHNKLSLASFQRHYSIMGQDGLERSTHLNSSITTNASQYKHLKKQTMSPSSRLSPMKSLMLAFGTFSALTTGTMAQTIAQDICACSPSQYEFTFDFSLTCPPVNITTGSAVSATSCLISPFGNPEVQDLVPVSVQTIDILELGQDLRVLVQENIAGNFGDGDSFVYSSIANMPDEVNSAVDIPRAIQLNVVGVNRLDEPIINVYIITFTNDCGAFPVLVQGQSAGWTVFGQLENARKEFCPLSPGLGEPTAPPPPTSAPVVPINPTLPPTRAPIDEGMPSPTGAPIEEPPSPPSTHVAPAPFESSMSMDFDMDVMMDSMESEFGLTQRKKSKKNKGDAKKMKKMPKAKVTHKEQNKLAKKLKTKDGKKQAKADKKGRMNGGDAEMDDVEAMSRMKGGRRRV